MGAILLVVAAVLYARGTWTLRTRAMSERAGARRALFFWAGWMFMTGAFGPPLASFAEVSFAAHMIQHELIMLAAAPLLVLARPLGVMIWGIPDSLRRVCACVTASGALRSGIAVATAPLAAWLLHFVVLWHWHVPAAFELALRSPPAHWAQHVSFFAAALFFWQSVFRAGRHGSRRGVAILSVFGTALHTSVLGALLTFSSHVWYPSYRNVSGAFGLAAVEDQQLGGLIMWVPGGLVFVAAALAIAALWLRDVGRDERFSGDAAGM